jgi:2'-5' RNA ligase
MQTKKSDTARVFFALWPEASVQQALHKLTKEYKPQCKGRAMRADTLHMTLQFMGDVERTRLPQLMQAADKVSVPPFGFILNRISFWKHNRIAYATLLAFVPALDQLVISLKRELAAAGFLIKNEGFVPHVTLLRNVEHVLESQTIAPIEWWADSFVLVESTVTDKGSRYQILHQWPPHSVITKC